MTDRSGEHPHDERSHVERGQIDRSIEKLDAAYLDELPLDEAIHRVTTSVQDLFTADGAGLMLVDEDSSLRYVGATDAHSVRLEAAQIETGHGPCVDSLVRDRVVHTDDLRADERWPQLRSALGDGRIRSVLGVPVHVSGIPIGSLNVYRSTPHAWDASEIDAIAAHSEVLEAVLAPAFSGQHQHPVLEQLRGALAARTVVERAIGVLMAERRIGSVDALDALRRRAQHGDQSLVETAAEVLTQYDD